MSRAAPRLRASLWVSAYMARLRAASLAHYVIARGDESAGEVLVKVARLNGQALLYERGFDLASGASGWRISAEAPETEIDAIIARQRGRDCDLWVIEVEDRSGAALLDQLD